ncbi:MAG: hypothetical protein PHE27_05530, partial [Alphaproteobacteria bacterium]|nr:hypothetical protein [Alphaproteobacteria bacterium]
MSGLFSLGHNGDEVMHSEFMGFALDEDSLDALRNWAEQHGYPSAVIQQGGMDMFAQLLGNSAPPKMVIVDIDGQKDPVSTISRVI